MVLISRIDPARRSSTLISYFEARHAFDINTKDPPLILFDENDIAPDYFQNTRGCIRWHKIKEVFYSIGLSFDKVTDLYKTWRDTREDIWIDGYDLNGKFVKTCFVEAAKRGNRVYKELLHSKFKFLTDLPPLEFFDDSKVDKRTPMLFVTLTVDPKQYDTADAWKSIGPELHIFETKLRQKYGSFVKLRVWESHESYYPHVHLVYYFPDREFIVFEHFSKDNKRTWRIPTVYKNSIASMWSMGNVDIQGVQDTLGAFSEVLKYITKELWKPKGDKTNAMVCLFNKQSYSISKDFAKTIWGNNVCIDLAEPNNTALVKQTVYNCNIEFPEICFWKFRGAVLHADLVHFLKKVPDDPYFWADPPPKIDSEMRFYFGIDSLFYGSLEDAGV